jgi:anti-sigma regulatory factor (Ser/Thr protein kinase)
MDERLETQLPGTTSAAAQARSFLRSALATWALDGFGEVTELLASELVTNSVVHVGGPLTLRVCATPERIRVEVDDRDATEPYVIAVGDESEHGRGVVIVDELASRWGSEHRVGGGKTVWFEIDLTTPAEDSRPT